MTTLRLATLLATAALGSAQSVVMPSVRATTPPPPNVSNAATFSSPESRTQLVYDVRDVAVATAFFTSLQIRRPANTSNVANVTFTTNATIKLSVSPLSPEAMTQTFAANHGTTFAMTVFSGPISLPAQPVVAWPAPWEAPIAFNGSFFYVGALGKSLVVDITQTGGSPHPWALEASPPDLGSSAVVHTPHPGCALASGSVYSIPQTSTPYVGGIVSIGYAPGGQPAHILFPAFAALGASGPGGSWAGSTLPIDLTPFGAPFCRLAVAIDVLVPLTAYPNGLLKSAPIAIPNDPNLGGQKFYDQGILLDAGANTLGVVTTVSSAWTVGTARGPGGILAATGTGSATAVTGSYSYGYVTTLRLN